VEMDLDVMVKAGSARRQVRPFVEEFTLPGKRHIYVLGEGRLINLASAEGHPAAVMDMSFANQALGAEFMVKRGRSLERKVYVVPTEIDREIARLKLASMGVAIDALSAEQESYLGSGSPGTYFLPGCNVRKPSCSWSWASWPWASWARSFRSTATGCGSRRSATPRSFSPPSSCGARSSPPSPWSSWRFSTAT